MRRIVIWPIAIGALICLGSGCGREPFPKKPLKSVKGFSLGGARFTPFKHRPSAQELYDATLKLYDSFKSVAISTESTSGAVSPQALETAGLLRIERVTGKGTGELRAIEPDKRLSVGQSGGSSMVFVTNGERSLIYDTGKGGTYHPSKTIRGHSAASDRAGLSAGYRYSTAPHRLLPDQVVNGTPTYVLELRRTPKGVGPRAHVTVLRLYLGKTDLLLRRSEMIDVKESITTVRGFVGNAKLSASIFPTKPPKDAKPAKAGHESP